MNIQDFIDDLRESTQDRDLEATLAILGSAIINQQREIDQLKHVINTQLLKNESNVVMLEDKSG